MFSNWLLYKKKKSSLNSFFFSLRKKEKIHNLVFLFPIFSIHFKIFNIIEVQDHLHKEKNHSTFLSTIFVTRY